MENPIWLVFYSPFDDFGHSSAVQSNLSPLGLSDEIRSPGQPTLSLTSVGKNLQSLFTKMLCCCQLRAVAFMHCQLCLRTRGSSPCLLSKFQLCRTTLFWYTFKPAFCKHSGSWQGNRQKIYNEQQQQQKKKPLRSTCIIWCSFFLANFLMTYVSSKIIHFLQIRACHA